MEGDGDEWSYDDADMFSNQSFVGSDVEIPQSKVRYIV